VTRGQYVLLCVVGGLAVVAYLNTRIIASHMKAGGIIKKNLTAII
jgi:hypothetical protein